MNVSQYTKKKKMSIISMNNKKQFNLFSKLFKISQLIAQLWFY